MRYILAAIAVASLVSPARAGEDPVKGEQGFRICMACHSVGPGAKNKVGPELNGVVGRKWGTVNDYAYSSEISTGKDQGRVWDDATLDDYLENPKHLVPHGKMSFTGFKSANQRAAVIEYLRQYDAEGSKK